MGIAGASGRTQPDVPVGPTRSSSQSPQLIQRRVYHRDLMIIYGIHGHSGYGRLACRVYYPRGKYKSTRNPITIAHELGHLNWRNAWNKNPDPSACFKSLLGLSWSSTVDGNGVDARARPWTDYGDDVGLHKGSIPKPHQATPAKLRTIYKGGFITALAAANQEKISWEPIRRC